MREVIINPTPAEIGERIRSYREKHGLSQKQMAELVGTGPSELCKYEKGTHLPSTHTLARIAKVMQCSIDYVYYGLVEQTVGKIDALLREPFIELQGFSEECRRAVYESAYAHMSKEIMQKRALRNPDTGIIPGKPKIGRNEA